MGDAAPRINNGRIRFGLFELDPQIPELRKGGIRIKTRGQPLQVLNLLVNRPGEAVTREELRQALWAQDTFVDFDHSLNTAIKRLRQALDDDPEHPRYIETVPRVGYRFIGAIEEGTEPAHTPILKGVSPPPEQRFRRPRLPFVLLAGAALVSIGLLAHSIFGHNNVTVPRRARVLPLTTLPGREIAPALSPDGTRVAFGWNGENNDSGYDLYVKVIGTEGQLRLTHSPGDWISTAWSPDGTQIALIRTGNDPGVFLVPALGGPERKIADASVGLVPGMLITWSPDATQLAVIRKLLQLDGIDVTGTGGIEILSLASLQAKKLQSSCQRAQGPSFSPDGKSMSYVCLETWSDCSLRVRELGSGTERVLMRGTGWMGGSVWVPGTTRLVFPMQLFDRDSDPQLWTIDVADGRPPSRIPDSHGATSVAVSGQKLAYAENRENTNIWKVSTNGTGNEEKVIGSTAEQNFPRISPDGRKIAFESTRSGSREIWVSDLDGSNPVKITSFGGPLTGSPSWSPDSKYLALDSRIGGKASLYIADVASGGIKKVETGTELNSIPLWSHDGKWIYFRQGEDANPTVWKISLDGGKAIQLTTIPDESSARESPDGKYLYAVRQLGKTTRLSRIHTDGSGDEKVLDDFQMRLPGDFSPSGDGVYFIADSNNGRQEIRFLSFATKRMKTIYRPPRPLRDWIGGLDVSPDGKWIFFTQLDSSESDLKLIENWQQ